MATRLQLRRDTAANWTSANPTLAQGEVGIETDTKKLKIGDGTTAWTSLAYGPAWLVSPVIDYAFANFASLKSPKEVVTVQASAATGTINFDAVTQADLYYTSNASANFTLNFRGNSSTTLNSFLAIGESITVVFENTNGTTAYYPTAFQIDGTSVTPKWQGGSAPSAGNASAIDVYTFRILKTAANTYTVYGAQTKFA